MRAILLSGVLIALFYAVPAFPQANSPAVKDDSLYSIALFASLKQMDKEWGHIDDSYQGVVRTDYHHVTVEKAPVITDNLPTQLGEYHVEFLDRSEQIDRIKAQHKGFAILSIFPLQNHGSELEITINVYYLQYQKGKFLMGLSDWSTVHFRYDCDGQRFVVTDVKLGGI